MGKINKISPVLNGLINYIKILPYQLQLDKYKTKLFDFFPKASIYNFNRVYLLLLCLLLIKIT